MYLTKMKPHFHIFLLLLEHLPYFSGLTDLENCFLELIGRNSRVVILLFTTINNLRIGMIEISMGQFSHK